MKGMTRRNFVKMAGIAMATAAAGSLWQDKTSLAETADAPAAPKAAEGGDHYVAPSQRQGGEAVVYFTRDLSAAGLLKAYDAIAQNMTGKVGIKLHTGEPHGPNIIPRPWVKTLIAEKLPKANIVETNTYYQARAIRRPSTARRWLSTAGILRRSISWMKRARLCCRSRAANGSRKCLWARTC